MRSFRPLSLAAALTAMACGLPMGAQEPATRLILAYSSYREDLGYPRIYFYRHDGAGGGGAAGGIPAGATRSDHRPTLALGGKLCAWTSEVVGKPSQISLWDVEGKKDLALPNLASGVADLAPWLSTDGQTLAFSTWRRPGLPGGWDLLLYDRSAAGVVTTPPVNTDQDDRMPALSGDGRWLAFTSHRPGGAGLSDIYLFDRKTGKLVELPGLNSAASEVEPSLSGDGRLIAFVAARPDGAGQRDVYVYDRQAAKLLPLPGLNSVAPEQAPCLTADGRYLAFVSERLDGAGGRDIYLYSLAERKLLPTPGLNSPRDDVDPALITAE